MSERITEAELRDIEGLCRDDDESAAAKEALDLIAEVRRLRGLIVDYYYGPHGDEGAVTLHAEAEAIRAEGKL